MGSPAVDGMASSALRICCHACHPRLPVVLHGPRWMHALDWTPTPPMRSCTPRCSARAAMTAHCRASDPLCVKICGATHTFGPASVDTHATSSMVQPLLHRTPPTDCGQPSAEPKFHRRRFVAAT